MIQWSPDTGAGWYHFTEPRIYGFSLTHLSGAGCPVFADLPILPWSDQPPDDRTRTPVESLAFRHTGESAHPGMYAVHLDDGAFLELAVTQRAGMAHLHFAPGHHAGLLVNAAGSANSDVHMAKLPPVGREHDGEGLTLQPDGRLTATITSGGFCGSATRYTLYVALRTHIPPTRTLLWQDGLAHPGRYAAGRRASAWLDLGLTSEVLVKVGLSYVSEAKAQANLDAELPGWNLAEVQHQAENTWAAALASIEIASTSSTDRTIFYTALYHNLLEPSIFSDTDGAYIGFDARQHQLAPGQAAQFANFSDWDTYRDTTPLQAWIMPKQASDMAQSLVNDAEQMGSFPRWAIANDSSYVMAGDSPAALLPEYNSFGASDFDRHKALGLLLRSATIPGLGIHQTAERTHLADDLRLGYLPASRDPTVWDDSASETLELATDDFAISAFAASLGDRATAASFRSRAGKWRNLLDPSTRWIRPRFADGAWLPNFNAEMSLPRVVNAPVSTDQYGFQEGNTYQYTFMVPFDYAGLFRAIGSDDEVERRLDIFFRKLVCWGEPCFNMANEPDFVTPFAYTFLGKPAKSAAVLTRIENETFNTTPSGLPGNDDLGATSAVYLWNALGLYPAIPGLGGLVLGTPRFSAATVHLASGQRLEITRSGEGIYVQSVHLNGAAHPSSWLRLADLRPGSNQLAFTMTTSPASTWATLPADRPPSASAAP